MAHAKVSSDALPALTGRRCVGTVMRRSEFPANKVVPQKSLFCPCSHGERGLFYFRKEYRYDEEITGETMVILLRRNAECQQKQTITQTYFIKEILL